MRLRFGRRETVESSAYRPPLLDQVSAQQLARLAAARWPTGGSPGRSPRRQRAGARLTGPIRRLVLSLLMLAFSGLIVGSMAYGASGAIGREEGLGWQDGLRLCLIALLSLVFLGQLLGLVRYLPGSSWLASNLRRHLRAGPPPPEPPLLDQVSARQLLRLAPPDFGAARQTAVVAARGRRFADVASWALMVLIVLVLAATTAFGSALGTWSALSGGTSGLPLALALLFTALASLVLVFLFLTGVRGLRDRRQRRRGRLLRRLLRFLLRLFDSGRRGVADAASISSRGGDLSLTAGGPAGLLQGSMISFVPAALESGGAESQAARSEPGVAGRTDLAASTRSAGSRSRSRPPGGLRQQTPERTTLIRVESPFVAGTDGPPAFVAVTPQVKWLKAAGLTGVVVLLALLPLLGQGSGDAGAAPGLKVSANDGAGTAGGPGLPVPALSDLSTPSPSPSPVSGPQEQAEAPSASEAPAAAPPGDVANDTPPAATATATPAVVRPTATPTPLPVVRPTATPALRPTALPTATSTPRRATPTPTLTPTLTPRPISAPPRATATP
jgi:hypothetical protein